MYIKCVHKDGADNVQKWCSNRYMRDFQKLKIQGSCWSVGNQLFQVGSTAMYEGMRSKKALLFFPISLLLNHHCVEMNHIIQTPERCELCSMEGNNATEIHYQIVAVYGKSIMVRQNKTTWVYRRIEIRDKDCSGHPSVAKKLRTFVRIGIW